MALWTGKSYWQTIDTGFDIQPALQGSKTCEVAVLGAGITGALVAYYLARAGVDVVLVDKRPLGTGSTAASTGLLQYEVDVPLADLQRKIGRTKATHAYRRGLEAIDELQALVDEIADPCGLTRRKSLYFASHWWHLRRLRREYECRREAGFEVEFLDRRCLSKWTTIRAPGALLSEGDAQVDPFHLTQALIRRATDFGLRTYAGTEIVNIDESENVVLHAPTGKIKAQRIVYATGYDAHQYLRRSVGTLHSTYAVASEPLTSFRGWPDGWLIWETARPYIYARQTADGRAIVGGGDTAFSNDHRRDRLVMRKTKSLKRRFERLFPEIPFTPACIWAGTFAETKDGLPFIGSPAGRPRAYFALGYGGNGITFSVIAARLIRDLYLRVSNDDERVFGFDR